MSSAAERIDREYQRSEGVFFPSELGEVIINQCLDSGEDWVKRRVVYQLDDEYIELVFLRSTNPDVPNYHEVTPVKKKVILYHDFEPIQENQSEPLDNET